MTPAIEDVGRVPDADMLPPEVASDASVYPLQRGICPSCASRDVVHLVIGMPAGPDDWGSGPAWVEWVGCLHPGYTRRCANCEATWTGERDLEEFADLATLMSAADATTLEQLGDWISEDYELDAEALLDGTQLIVRFGTRGIGFGFPVRVDDFWETLDQLHDEVSDELELDEDE